MTTDSLEEVLSPKDAREAIVSGKAHALDIRDEEDVEESRIPGASHITEEVLEERMSKFPTDTPVVVVCADGKRSKEVAAQLREKGQEAASIKGGMKAWQSEGLPALPRPDDEYEGPDLSSAGPGA